MKIKLKRSAKFVLVIFVLLIFFAVLFEGFSSFIIFLGDLTFKPARAEEVHTEYDDLLGWVNIPNTYVEDMYADDVYLKINSQGFRNNKDFGVEVPEGKKRIICSGDSMTLGYGVDNDNTWCQWINRIDEDFETVNMGQGGYGVDQAYLWYKRDGINLDHDVQIFAFITRDFDRMKSDNFHGYPKPVLSFENSRIEVGNIPVPKDISFLPFLIRENSNAIKGLRTFKLAQGVSKIIFGHEQAFVDSRIGEYGELVLAVFGELNELNKQKGSRLILLYLPMPADFDNVEISNEWRNYIQTAAEKNGWLYIDLIQEFNKLSPRLRENMFIREGEIDYPGATGHFNEKGNEYVAGLLYQKIKDLF